ncbi:hypothetical protein [Staphylococcus phage LY01]|nr:hypothetical protein [Staphylococcus phage LY01]
MPSRSKYNPALTSCSPPTSSLKSNVLGFQGYIASPSVNMTFLIKNLEPLELVCAIIIEPESTSVLRVNVPVHVFHSFLSPSNDELNTVGEPCSIDNNDVRLILGAEPSVII